MKWIQAGLQRVQKIIKDKSFRHWAFGAAVLIAVSFFVGSWMEDRIQKNTLEHDAKLIAVLHAYAPESTSSAIRALQAENDPILVVRGAHLLIANHYEKTQDNIAIRSILTWFTVLVMVVRGLKLSINVRGIYKHFRKIWHQRKGTIPANDCDTELKEALAELSAELKTPVEHMTALADAALQQNLDPTRYHALAIKLQQQAQDLNTFITSLTAPESEKDA